jgi:hypothetical protein
MHGVRTLLINAGRAAAFVVLVGAAGLSVGCDNSKSTTKTTEKRVEDTPQGKKTTTETHEKTVDIDKK